MQASCGACMRDTPLAFLYNRVGAHTQSNLCAAHPSSCLSAGLGQGGAGCRRGAPKLASPLAHQENNMPGHAKLSNLTGAQGSAKTRAAQAALFFLGGGFNPCLDTHHCISPATATNQILRPGLSDSAPYRSPSQNGSGATLPGGEHY